MAHHKSAKKRIRTSERRRVINKNTLASVRTAVKKFENACKATGEEKVAADALKTLFTSAQSSLSRAVKKGILHKNTVSRKTSRLAAMLKRSAA